MVGSCFAALSSAANGDARNELSIATSVEADDAPDLVGRLSEILGASDGLTSALGLWVKPSIPINATFGQTIPALTVAPMPSAKALDQWVQQATSGMLTEFPGGIPNDALMIASSAICADATWTTPFRPYPGQWMDDPNWIPWLLRSRNPTSDAAILETKAVKVGRVIFTTDSSFDVHLLTGDEGMSPSEVLSIGLDALTDDETTTVVPGSELRSGDSAGCLTVDDQSYGEPNLSVSLPPFTVSSEWKMTDHSETFGLTTATDDSRGHFNLLSPEPLAIGACTQTATASFSAEGFRAAAVTSILASGAGARPNSRALRITVHLNRPFAFLCVHRDSGITLFAGWVTEPAETEIDPDSYLGQFIQRFPTLVGRT